MDQISEWYDDPAAPPDATVPYVVPFAVGGTTPSVGVKDFFDDPQPRVDAGRIPSKNGGLPVDIDVVSILAGEAGLASKPDAAGIADGVSEGKVLDVRDLLAAVVRRIAGDKNPLANLIIGWLDDDDTPAWLPNLSDWADDIPESMFVQAIIDSLFNGYHHTSGSGADPADLSMTMAHVDNRITALEGGGMLFSLTSSTTVDLRGYTVAKFVLIGSSTLGEFGQGSLSGAPGTHGGYLAMEVTTEYLESLGVDLAAVPVEVGTAGAPTRFASYASGQWVGSTTPGTSAIAGDMRSFVPTATGVMGIGGAGGRGLVTNGASGTDGNNGGNTILGGIGGLGGQYNSSGAGQNGGHGSPARIDGPVKGGGSGGGGGAGGGVIGGVLGQNGGTGGNGAYPGGAPGGGGGRGSGTTSGGAGPSGAVANGYAEVEAR